MAISFEESKKQALKLTETPMPTPLANDTVSVNSTNEVFEPETEKYAWFDGYIDNNISLIVSLFGVTTKMTGVWKFFIISMV